MQGTILRELLFDSKIEKIARATQKVVQLARLTKEEKEKEHYYVIMANPQSRRTMRDYCRRTNVGQISLGFQPTNPISFDTKNIVLAGLRDKQFNGSAMGDLWEHLNHFYETCSLYKLKGVIYSKIKLRLFEFSLTRRAQD